MSEKEYIEREAFIETKRKQYCADCDRRKGMKNGKMRFCYEIGEAPCRACYVDDLLTDVEDAPAADVVEVVRCKDCRYYLNYNEKCELIGTRLHFYETDKRWTEDSFCAWGERKGGDNP